jgi:hypothetical protein
MPTFYDNQLIHSIIHSSIPQSHHHCHSELQYIAISLLILNLMIYNRLNWRGMRVWCRRVVRWLCRSRDRDRMRGMWICLVNWMMLDVEGVIEWERVKWFHWDIKNYVGASRRSRVVGASRRSKVVGASRRSKVVGANR